MDFVSVNPETVIRPGPGPEPSYPLTEKELVELWFFFILELGHLLDIPVRVISSGP